MSQKPLKKSRDRAAAAKELSSKLDELNRKARESSTRSLWELLQVSNDLSCQASEPREQIQNLVVVEILKDNLKAEVQQLVQSDGLSPSDFVNGLLRRFSIAGVGDGDEEEGTSEHSLDWTRLGMEHAVEFLRPSISFGTMLGPLSAEAPRGKARTGQKRQRDRITGEKTSPDAADENGDGASAETVDRATLRRVNGLHKAIARGKNGSRGTPVLPLVVDRESFTSTIENIFALSFLVKGGLCQLSAVEGADTMGSIIAVAKEKVEDGRARDNIECGQFILRLDHSDWLKLKDCTAMPCTQD